MEPLLVLTNVPDRGAAEKLALALVECRAAACVNVLPACRSIFRWQGAVEARDEIPLLIKTTAANYPLIEAIVRAQHPDEVPELIAVPITHGLPAYLDWVATETEKHD
ncbi:MAG TPA: divalent-cation tolerance protein CutA [Thiobacillus sp.]|nr:divalent-cation tolerance protein CutA [Thiobacillus sp.]